MPHSNLVVRCSGTLGDFDEDTHFLGNVNHVLQNHMERLADEPAHMTVAPAQLLLVCQRLDTQIKKLSSKLKLRTSLCMRTCSV